jgi:polar amino acid transport system substrate-binding protein
LDRGKTCAAIVALAGLALGMAAAIAQTAPFVPSFWDPNRRLTKPDSSAVHLIRFLTADDYPPFNFTLPDGTLTGFNVDLARAICDELQIACTIQARRWDTLIASLDENKGDALIASLAVNPQTRAQVDFTSPYMILPGRFVIRANKPPASAATPEKLAGARVGVVAGSAHEAWLKAAFPKIVLQPFDTADSARTALARGDLDAIFGDAISLSVWLNGASSRACCAFFGGPFVDADYFGEGVAIGVRKNNVALRRLLDYALAKIAEKGAYSELYLKYFPVGAF